MGLNVVVAVTEAGMCHLLLFAVDILSEKDTHREREREREREFSLHICVPVPM